MAVALSLLGTQLVMAAHAVRVHGSGTLKQTWSIDFDGGKFNTTNLATEDMQFDAVSQNHRYLQPEGSALIRKMGSSRPTYAKCASVALSPTPIGVKTFPVGTWFCFKTNSNRFVRFRVDAVHSDPGPITLTYLTWEL